MDRGESTLGCPMDCLDRSRATRISCLAGTLANILCCSCRGCTSLSILRGSKQIRYLRGSIILSSFVLCIGLYVYGCNSD
jgi:hypothetical protein